GERLTVTEGPARGSVLEVTEETGLGTTVNVIIYDGTLRQGDSVILGGRDEIITTKIRALLLPKPLDEMKDPRDKFTSVNEVTAAAGVKVAAPNLEGALAGSPLYATLDEKDTEDYLRQVADEIGRLRISTDKIGIVLKTDTLGSLEAITAELKKSDVSIRLADVGDISRRDVIEAESVRQKDEILGVILGFNVRLLSDAKEEAQNKAIKIFQQNIIYHLIDDYLIWVKEERTRKVEEAFEDLVLPCKIKILPGYIFRRSRPAIVGVEILGGRLRTRVRLIDRKGREVGQVSQIQDRGESLTEAIAGMQVAVSIRGSIVGRHIHEDDLLYVQIPEEHVRVLLRRFEQELDPREMETLQELIEIMRGENAFWGI
ncbi:MAG: translation initiation factor IF-2, partial [Candidatus Bathyarchaeota archaeon]